MLQFNKFSLFFFVFALALQLISASELTFCVEDARALSKCEKMTEYVKDVVDLKCKHYAPCKDIVARNEADVTVVDADDHHDVLEKLEAVLYENYGDDNIIVAVIDVDQESKVDTLPLAFKEEDYREAHGALYLNRYRDNAICKRVKPAAGTETIKVMRYHELTDKTNKKLVCVKNGKVAVKPVEEYKDCNVEANIPHAVMVKKGSDKKDKVVEMLEKLAVEEADDFKLFGKYDGKENVIFTDEAKNFVKDHPAPNGVTVQQFVELHCGNVKDFHN